jgi:hypothetical protein
MGSQMSFSDFTGVIRMPKGVILGDITLHHHAPGLDSGSPIFSISHRKLLPALF